MADAQETVRRVHEYLDEVDWEVLERGVAAAGVAARFCREHPWVLIAAGGMMSALGGFFALMDHRESTGSERLGSRSDAASERSRFRRADDEHDNGFHLDPDYVPAP